MKEVDAKFRDMNDFEYNLKVLVTKNDEVLCDKYFICTGWYFGRGSGELKYLTEIISNIKGIREDGVKINVSIADKHMTHEEFKLIPIRACQKINYAFWQIEDDSIDEISLDHLSINLSLTISSSHVRDICNKIIKTASKKTTSNSYIAKAVLKSDLELRNRMLDLISMAFDSNSMVRMRAEDVFRKKLNTGRIISALGIEPLEVIIRHSQNQLRHSFRSLSSKYGNNNFIELAKNTNSRILILFGDTQDNRNLFEDSLVTALNTLGEPIHIDESEKIWERIYAISSDYELRSYFEKAKCRFIISEKNKYIAEPLSSCINYISGNDCSTYADFAFELFKVTGDNSLIAIMSNGDKRKAIARDIGI